MIDILLLDKVEKLLGKSKPTARGNYSFKCPICKDIERNKLEINLDNESVDFQKFNCWVCGFRGTALNFLFNKINKDVYIPFPKHKQINNKNKQLNNEIVELPKEFQSLLNVNLSHPAITFLKNRGIFYEDIIKYNLGYCSEGIYRDRIIIPSYDVDNNLNYYTARSYNNNPLRYINPSYSRNIIPFENMINWNLPIILCEGPFDMFSIKRNAIPLLGKTLSDRLLSKLMNVNEVYVVLDKTAIKQAIEICTKLLNINKEVYLVDLPKKDPNELGFETVTQIINNTKPISFSSLLIKKLSII